MSTPLPRPSGSWCSNASLDMLAIDCASKSAELLNNSGGMSLSVIMPTGSAAVSFYFSRRDTVSKSRWYFCKNIQPFHGWVAELAAECLIVRPELS